MDHLSSSASIVMVLGLIAICLGITLIVCWIVLPIAVIGIKPLIRELIREQQTTNRLLEAQTRSFDTFSTRYISPPRMV